MKKPPRVAGSTRGQSGKTSGGQAGHAGGTLKQAAKADVIERHEAQRFPKDYDGIVAGAPANNWTTLLTSAIWTEQALGEPGAWLSPAKLAVVSKAVFAECHGESRYVDDPAQCHFDPASLVCKAGQSDGCLTGPEAAALAKIYSGAQDANGKPIFPGYSPEGEAGPTAWGLWIRGRTRRTSRTHS